MRAPTVVFDRWRHIPTMMVEGTLVVESVYRFLPEYEHKRFGIIDTMSTQYSAVYIYTVVAGGNCVWRFP